MIDELKLGSQATSSGATLDAPLAAVASVVALITELGQLAQDQARMMCEPHCSKPASQVELNEGIRELKVERTSCSLVY